MSNDVALEKFYQAGSDYFRIQIVHDPDCGSPREADNGSIFLTWESGQASPDSRSRMPEELDQAVSEWIGNNFNKPIPALKFKVFCREFLKGLVYEVAGLQRQGDGRLLLDFDPAFGVHYDGLALVTLESWKAVMGASDPKGEDHLVAGYAALHSPSARELLVEEVAEYNHWVIDNCWGYVVERAIPGGWEDVGSCFGFIGEHDAPYMLEQAVAELPSGYIETDGLPEVRSAVNPADEDPAQRYAREVEGILRGFETEFCEECGLDLPDHVISADPLGHPHSWCKYPGDQDKKAQDLVIAELQAMAGRLTDADAISDLSNDDEIVELRLALSVALSRWPEIEV